MVQCLNVSLPSTESKGRSNGPTPQMTFCLVTIYLAKKDKNNLTNEELRRFDFLTTIKEYVGASETPLSTTKR